MGPGWRNRIVTVNGLRVRLIDSCDCQRVVDLFSDVVVALGLRLSRGVYPVVVSW
jgi:hypothetical protein